MKRLLIIKTGDPPPTVLSRRGTFESWITRLCGLADSHVFVVDVTAGEPLPPAASAPPTVVTGSAAMVTERLDWSERTAAWLANAVACQSPAVLGICYGHQLLAHALDGEVAVNPLGREIGTVDSELTDAGKADPLLGVLPPRFGVQTTHVESVTRLPSGARLLSRSAKDPHHAFALGSCCWGVQFHPEFDADVVRGYIQTRANAIAEEGLDSRALSDSARDTPHGEAILRRFVELTNSA